MNEETPRRGELARSQIVAAAYDLFIRQGFHGTSMRQIARSAGVALGSVYNHFDSKAAVFHAVFLTYHPWREIIPAMLDAPGDTVEAFLSNAMRVIMEKLATRPDLLNLMFIELIELKSAQVADIFSVIAPESMTIIQKIYSLDDGKLRQIPPMMIMRIFMSVFIGFFLSESAFRPHLPAEFGEGGVEHFIDVVLHGLLTTEG